MKTDNLANLLKHLPATKHVQHNSLVDTNYTTTGAQLMQTLRGQANQPDHMRVQGVGAGCIEMCLPYQSCWAGFDEHAERRRSNDSGLETPTKA
mmetsp:Transcript_36089/g.103763  ORF Transcript_36089/g.103763 Transcript_36089/m.103763 type:complete len:94 (-) Transcript_36089:144-425(-)